MPLPSKSTFKTGTAVTVVTVTTVTVISFAGVAPPIKLPAIVIVSESAYPRPAALISTLAIVPFVFLTTSNVAPLPFPAVVEATALNVPASSDVNVRLILAVWRNAADSVTWVALSTDATVTLTARLPLPSSATASPTLIPVVSASVAVNAPWTQLQARGPVVVCAMSPPVKVMFVTPPANSSIVSLVVIVPPATVWIKVILWTSLTVTGYGIGWVRSPAFTVNSSSGE